MFDVKNLIPTLGYLYANYNDLNGESLRLISQLVNLRELGMVRNLLSDIKGMEKLTALQKVWFDKNNIADIEPLTQDRNLTELYASHNKISKIPDKFVALPLTKLDLSFNNISDTTILSNITNLTDLNLGSNNFSALPDLSKLRLRNLDVSFNPLNSFPDMLTKMSSLERLNLQGDGIE